MQALKKKLMPRLMLSVILSCTFSGSVWAVEEAATAATTPPTATQNATTSHSGPTSTTPPTNTVKGVIQTTALTLPKPLTAEQIVKEKAAQDAREKALVKDQVHRLQLLEKANLEALAQNQELQLKNDNLAVQVQVLQSESSAQMFIYGAATIAVGVILGFFIASYIYTKRRRQW